MNKAESKYFNTAMKMDKALLELLETKDYEYITIKEICTKANVNRSTFYLHYENMEDLLSETIEYVDTHFLKYMEENIEHTHCSLDELYLTSSKYLVPYLNYIQENKKLFMTVLHHANLLQRNKAFDKMFKKIFIPILERLKIDKQKQDYMIAFYIHGIMAIIEKWIEEDCVQDIDFVVNMIQMCTKRRNT